MPSRKIVYLPHDTDKASSYDPRDPVCNRGIYHPSSFSKKIKRRIKSNIKKNGFYASDKWRALRYRALKIHGAKCQCCGRTPKDHGVSLHVDHIKPRSKFPELQYDIRNTQILCEDCNLGKMAYDSTDWR